MPKKVLITGGSGGIGTAIAKRLLADGFAVMIASRDKQQLDLVKKEIAGIETGVLDVSDEASVSALAEKIREHWGSLDVLVNAAAILGPIAPVSEISLADWRKTIDVDLTGTFLMTKAVIPLMREAKGGRIINFVGGGDGPRPNFSAYVSAKGAIARFTETIAEELKPDGIAVNAIAPGAVNTKLLDEVIAAGQAAGKEYPQAVEQKKSGGVSPEKAADLIAFLVSESASGLTGKIFSAVWDKYHDLPKHLKEVSSSDVYNYRRIKPADRGFDW